VSLVLGSLFFLWSFPLVGSSDLPRCKDCCSCSELRGTFGGDGAVGAGGGDGRRVAGSCGVLEIVVKVGVL
jgi:hypothetical protein